MASKTDLESEVAGLKRELDAVRAAAAARNADARHGEHRSGGDATMRSAPESVRNETEERDAGPEAATGSEDSKDETQTDTSTLDWALSQLDGTELDRLFKQFVDELEHMQAQRPLLSLFGAFVLGYVLGRAR